MKGYGILVLHGLFGKPENMCPLTEALKPLNVKIVCPMLPGHTSPKDLKKISPNDYITWVNTQLIALKELCPKGVFIIGFSLGAVLALISAERYSFVKGLVLLSAPIEMPWYASLVAKLFHNLPVAFPSLKGGVFEDRDAASRHTSHSSFYFASVDAYRKIVESAKNVLPHVNVPTLIISARKDNVVSYHNAEKIFVSLSSPNKKILILERGGHIILKDIEKETVFNFIRRFLQDQIIT